MRAPVLQLAFLFSIAPVVFGSTDISGKWGVRAQTTSGPAATVGCLVEMSKCGMALSVAGSCQLIGAVTLAGTIDATAGARVGTEQPDAHLRQCLFTTPGASPARGWIEAQCTRAATATP